jgi:hypothetical protein
MKSFEIFYSDLTDEAKARLIQEGFNAHENIDIMPLAIVDQEAEEVEE